MPDRDRSSQLKTMPFPARPVLLLLLVGGMEIVLRLRAHRAGTLAQSARGSAGNVHADRDGGQPGIQVFRMPVHRRTLQDAAEIIAGSILTGAVAEPIEVDRRLEFPQAVVEAVKERWPEPPSFDLWNKDWR